jgi:hypothetical protein
MAADIAVLEPAHEHRVEHGSGDHSELTQKRYGSGKLPVRYGHSHSTLNDLR